MNFSANFLNAISNSTFLEHFYFDAFPSILFNKNNAVADIELPIEIERYSEEDGTSVKETLSPARTEKAEEMQPLESGNIFSQGHSGCNPFNFTAKEHTTIASVAYEISANFQHKVQPFLSTETSFINTKPFYDAYQGASQAAAINGILVSAGKLAFAPPAAMLQIAPQMIAIQQPLIALPKVVATQPNDLLSQEAEIFVEEAPFFMARALVDLPERPMQFSGLDEEIQTHFSTAAENILKEYEIKDTATRILETNTTQWNAMVQIAKDNKFTDSAVNKIILEIHHTDLVQKLKEPEISSLEKDYMIKQLTDILFDEQYIAYDELYDVIAEVLEEENWLSIAKEAFNVDVLTIEDEQFILGELLKVKFSEETLQSMLDEFQEQLENDELDHDVLANKIANLVPEETVDTVQHMSLLEKIAYLDFVEEIIPRMHRDALLLANGEDNDLPEDSEITEETDYAEEDAPGAFTNDYTDFSSMMSTLADMMDEVLGNGSVEDLNEEQRGILDVVLGLYEKVKGLMTVSETLAEDTSESTEFRYDDSYETVSYRTAEEEAEYDDAFTAALNRMMNTFDTYYGYTDEPLVETTDSVDLSWDSYDSYVTIDIAPELLTLSDVEETVSITLADPRVSPALYSPVSVEDMKATVDAYDDLSIEEMFEQLTLLRTLHAEAYPIPLSDALDINNFDSLYDPSADTDGSNSSMDSLVASTIDFSTLFSTTSTDLVVHDGLVDTTAYISPAQDSIIDFSSLFPATEYL